MMLTASPHSGMLGAVISRAQYAWWQIGRAVHAPFNGWDGNMPDPREGMFQGEEEFEPIYHRAFTLERKERDTQEKVRGMQESISNIKHLLPPAILVSKNKSGELEISNEFWHAILAKIKSERISGMLSGFSLL